MKYFPVFVDLEDRKVVVVGGGEPAVQKTRLLLKTSARIEVIAGEPNSELIALAQAGRITLRSRPFAPADLDGATLSYAATGDHAANAPIAEAARARGILVNVVDEPAPSTFITPAIVDRDPVVVAIGTEGTSPVLARDVKTHLEAHLPAGLGTLARRTAGLRERIAAAVPDMMQRRRFWERLLKGPFRQAALAGDDVAAEAAVAKEIDTAEQSIGAPGRVLLIGCGPGAGDLLTLRALDALQQADVLVIDRLVPEAIVEKARREAKRIYVGKAPGAPSTPQDDINTILVREGLKGQSRCPAEGRRRLRVRPRRRGDCRRTRRWSRRGRHPRHHGGPRLRRQHWPAADAAPRHPRVRGADWGHRRRPLGPRLAGPGARWPCLRGLYGRRDGGHDPPRAVGGRRVAGDVRVVVVENGTLDGERVIATVLRDLDACVAAEAVKAPAILFFGLDWAAAGLTRPAKVKAFARTEFRLERCPRCRGDALGDGIG